jgi:hypothetical protein
MSPKTFTVAPRRCSLQCGRVATDRRRAKTPNSCNAFNPSAIVKYIRPRTGIPGGISGLSRSQSLSSARLFGLHVLNAFDVDRSSGVTLFTNVPPCRVAERTLACFYATALTRVRQISCTSSSIFYASSQASIALGKPTVSTASLRKLSRRPRVGCNSNRQSW